LTPLGRRVLDGKHPEYQAPFKQPGTPFTLLDSVIDKAYARACAQLMDRQLYEVLVPESSRIPLDSITGMTESYSERLPKVMRFKTAFLDWSRRKKNAPSYATAEKIGLIEMMKSESFAKFAESITGLDLLRPAACQVVCYEHGDYQSAHVDYYPEKDPTCIGCVDVHVMMSNDAVKHQFMMYEKNHHFNHIVEVNLPAGISVYRLPFWHQVTPLVGKKGREHEARRWLLLGTFQIAQKK